MDAAAGTVVLGDITKQLGVCLDRAQRPLRAARNAATALVDRAAKARATFPDDTENSSPPTRALHAVLRRIVDAGGTVVAECAAPVLRMVVTKVLRDDTYIATVGGDAAADDERAYTRVVGGRTYVVRDFRHLLSAFAAFAPAPMHVPFGRVTPVPHHKPSTASGDFARKFIEFVFAGATRKRTALAWLQTDFLRRHYPGAPSAATQALLPWFLRDSIPALVTSKWFLRALGDLMDPDFEGGFGPYARDVSAPVGAGPALGFGTGSLDLSIESACMWFKALLQTFQGEVNARPASVYQQAAELGGDEGIISAMVRIFGPGPALPADKIKIKKYSDTFSLAETLMTPDQRTLAAGTAAARALRPVLAPPPAPGPGSGRRPAGGAKAHTGHSLFRAPAPTAFGDGGGCGDINAEPYPLKAAYEGPPRSGPPRSDSPLPFEGESERGGVAMDVDVDPDEALERYAYWMDVEEAAAFVDGDEDIVTRVLVALLEDDL